MSVAARKRSFKVFNRFVKELKANFPTKLPIKIVRKDLGEYFGYCTKSKKYFYIYLDKSLDENTLIYVLIHEICHPLTWNDQKVDHGQEFGKMYSRVYRFWEKFYRDYHKQ